MNADEGFDVPLEIAKKVARVLSSSMKSTKPKDEKASIAKHHVTSLTKRLRDRVRHRAKMCFL